MKKLLVICVVAVVAAVALANFSRSSAGARRQTAAVALAASSMRNETFERLADIARRDGGAHVIVQLNLDFQPEGSLSKSRTAQQRGGIKTAQQSFLNEYAARQIKTVKRFEYIPYLAFEADAPTLARMRDDARIAGIEEDIIGEGALAESVPVVGAPTAWASGYSGSGQTVAILDSGVDKNHNFLSGKVVSEACYSSNTATSTSVCPNGAIESTAADSGLHCPTTVEGCAHGTHVAGIAAGRGTAASGVAKDANVIAIQMFSRFETTASCGGTAPCARYWTSDLIRALERVRTLSQASNNIAAVNLSLQTGQQFVSNCDGAHSATKAAIDNLRSVGIATIICSGNFSFTNALTAPACISTAVSVGSTEDGSLGTTLNAVAATSDSSPLLHLLAPGRWINSSVPNNQFQNYTGTSMAAPHVAGAFAILRQRRPDASPTRILNALVNTGQPITDARNGLVKPRIRIDAALNAVSSASPPDFDGDGRADVSVFRSTNGVWYLNRSTEGFTGIAFGQANDLIVPADYDGDGKTDVAVFRSGTWFLQRSSQGFTGIAFGAATDVPVPADFDGDGKAELAVYRQSNGTWYIYNLATNQTSGVFFGASEDKPVPADYDGDGRGDVAVFRPSNGTWYLQRSQLGFTGVQFGDSADKPVAADYDGDGKIDVAVFRPSNGTWYLNRSQLGFAGVAFGLGTDAPVPADYDGDGKTDVAVFRDGTWYLNRSTQGFTSVAFGAASDKPVPNAFVP